MLNRARPVVERRGSLARKAGFYAQFANQRARENGFRIDEALELWEGNVLPYQFKWLCLWPLVGVRLASGQVAEAVDASRQLHVRTGDHRTTAG